MTDDILKSLDLPSKREQYSALNAKIIITELNAVSIFKPKKHTRADRTISHWYKTFKLELMPLPLNCCNYTIYMPQIWYNTISAVPQKAIVRKNVVLKDIF